MKCHLLKRQALPSREFVEWCREVPTIIPNQMQLDQFIRERNKSEPDQNKLIDSFVENVHSAIQGGIASVSLNQSMTRPEIKLSGGKASWDKGLHQLHITHTISGNFTIENVSIRELSIDITSPDSVAIQLNRCNIARFSLDKSQRIGGPVKIVCKNTNIGFLKMQENAVRSLKMDGGCILDIACPPPGAKSPITGDVAFSNVFFPRNTEDYLLSGAQAYRSFRHHLMTLQNIQAANLIRSAELAVERESDRGMNQYLGLLYEWFSDYGSSTWRPLAWLTGAFLLSLSAIYCSNGATQGLPDSAMYAGWRSVLIEHDGNVWQALYLAFQPIINPLGIFSSKALLVPRHGWLAFLLMVQGLLSPVWIALFIFAVRRRFRLHG